MKVCFSGLSEPLLVDDAAVSVLEVHNKALFARMCEALISGLGVDAIEPYSLWVDDLEVGAVSRFLVVGSPLQLPWDDKGLVSGLAARFEQEVLVDEESRHALEESRALLQSRLSQVALGLESDYAFSVDWELKRYLRTFGFGVDIADGEPLIDKLIKFLRLVKDAAPKKALLFVNLKLFLTKSELDMFFEQVFFLRLHVLLIENVRDDSYEAHERKYVIDQDLIESW